MIRSLARRAASRHPLYLRGDAEPTPYGGPS